MKSKLIITLLCISLTSQAQNKDNKWGLGVVAGTTEYAGDLGNGFADFSTTALNNNWVGGVSISRYLNPIFDFGLSGTYGTWGYYKSEIPFKSEMLVGTAALKFKFNNGYLIEEDSRIAPYIFAGSGFARLKGSEVKPGAEFPVTAGAGLGFQLTDMVWLNYQATYGYLSTDKRDFNEGGASNDALLIHAVGVNFNLGKQSDLDEDGVPDKKDKCPETPRNAIVDQDGCALDTDQDGVADYLDICPNKEGSLATKGCPDADKDGVADGDDQCPNESGLADLKGCPDTDGDWIIDSKDKCPNVRGRLALDGCPDMDGDEIKDDEDKCPDVPGVVLFAGCPDTDMDSISDMQDMCPYEKGPVSTKGCPDTDNDGVTDNIDRCPTVAGPSGNAGCPEVKREVKQLFQKALQGIQFETGKAIIKPVSFPILDAIVLVMVENPKYKLLIGGHTDDAGDDQSNLTLSHNRAESVARYLISKGADPLRIEATGYGETKPVDTNQTNAGKARNRRVELKVEFLQ